MNTDRTSRLKDVAYASEEIRKLRGAVASAVVGQDELLDGICMALLVGGHVLIEGVPGLAKTLAARSFASALEGSFSRIQFTPDLLPADVVGTMVLDPSSGSFRPKKGPVFANIVLADEINRAPAKVQSALLEAMEERQVTIGDHTFDLPDPFLVIATQNPIEQEGTYPLPEAELDRFLVKLVVTYPNKEYEAQVVRMHMAGGVPDVPPVMSVEKLKELSAYLSSVYLDERIVSYALDLVRATRSPADVGLGELVPLIAYGASPRATVALAKCARALALIEGSDYVLPEHVKKVALPVLRHRLVLTYEAEAEGVGPDQVVRRILETVDVP